MKRPSKRNKSLSSRACNRQKKNTYDENMLSGELYAREKYFDIFAVIVLLVLGTYHSVLYFGYKLIPTSDFPGLVRLGHELLSFQFPSSFMQAPVTGTLQAALSYLVGGQHPDLTAGWLLNAILHPLNAVLIFLVGKKIIGKSAVWPAIICTINPWVIYSLTDPIVETTLLFFVLLTFYFIFRHSRWSYFFASVTMMVRYEGAALILAAFIMDLIVRKTKKERLLAFLYSAIASLPLIIWLAGTFYSWQINKDSAHYLKEFGAASGGKFVLLKFIQLLWEVGFHIILRIPPAIKAMFGKISPAEAKSISIFLTCSKIIAAVSFIFGVLYGLLKRNWYILMLLIFFVPYLLIHAVHSFAFYRFLTTVHWIALIICWFGLMSFWKIINAHKRIPKAVVVVLQLLVLALAAVWLVMLVPHLLKINKIAPKHISYPVVAIVLTTIIFAFRIYIYRSRYLLRELAIIVLMCCFIISNQFMLVNILSYPDRDKEFVLLADWYYDNIKSGEKLAVYMGGTVKIFLPKESKQFIVGIPVEKNLKDFTDKLYEDNVRYIVWASREMRNPSSVNYKRKNLKNLEPLYKPRDVGPFKFVTQVGSQRGWVNVFRLQPMSDSN